MYLCFQYPQNKDKNAGTFHSVASTLARLPLGEPSEKYSIDGIESSSSP
jgi:hypothetical protein